VSRVAYKIHRQTTWVAITKEANGVHCVLLYRRETSAHLPVSITTTIATREKKNRWTHLEFGVP